jgi:hypothetical protein
MEYLENINVLYASSRNGKVGSLIITVLFVLPVAKSSVQENSYHGYHNIVPIRCICLFTI